MLANLHILLLRQMRHQELSRAVGTHYGTADSDLRAYGPCHRRDGTAGTPELLPQLPQPGLGTISDDSGPAAFRRSKDLAAAA